MFATKKIVSLSFTLIFDGVGSKNRFSSNCNGPRWISKAAFFHLVLSG